MTVEASLYRAKKRCERVGSRLRGTISGAEDTVRRIANLPEQTASGLTVGGASNDVLTAQERAGLARFAGMDFSDRNKEYDFEATDERGRRGRYRTTVNQLLLLESQGYSAALQQITSTLDRLAAAGFITRQRPTALNVARFQYLSTQPRWHNGEWDEFSYGSVSQLPTRIADPRLLSGDWADWPNYAGLKPPGYNQPETAFLYNQFSSGPWLSGLPLPQGWNKWFPTERLFNRNDFSDDAFIAAMEVLAVQSVALKRAANANPEWSPDLNLFLNGVYPWWVPNVGVYQEVNAQFQYRTIHPFAVLTKGESIATSGVRLVGKQDTALFLASVRARSPRAWAEKHDPAGPWNNSWANIHYADSIASFMQIVNMAEFVASLGAEAHVYASLEYHSAILQKAYDELGLPAGSSVQQYIDQLARERSARSANGGGSGGGLALVSGPTASADRQIANQVLNAAAVVAMQLFLVNPIVGAVAAGIVGLSILLTNLFLGTAFDCQAQNLLVRDGRVPVRSIDVMECQASTGDNYGGNYLPHTRIHAIQGRPVLRVKDQYGRTISV